MKTSKELREERQRIWVQMEDIHKHAEEKDGVKVLNTEERSSYDKLDKRFVDLDEQIKSTELFEKRRAEMTVEIGGDPADPEPKKKEEDSDQEYSEKRTRAFEKYFRKGYLTLESEERQLLKEARTQTAGTDSQGGYLVPEGHSREIEKSLKDYIAIMQVADVRRTASGNTIIWPTNDDTANKGRILAEATGDASAGGNDLVFGFKQLDAYKYTSDLIKVSSELLEDEETDLVAYLGEALGERLGRILNEHTTTGTGTAQPNGAVTASTLGKTAASNAAITRGEIVDLIHSVNPAYRRSPSAALMFNDATFAAIRKLAFGSADDRPLYQVSPIAGQPDLIEGERFVINPDMANIATVAKTMLYGDFSKYKVRIVRDVVVKRAEERYIENDVVAWVAFMRFDGELINTAAVKHLVHPV